MDPGAGDLGEAMILALFDSRLSYDPWSSISLLNRFFKLLLSALGDFTYFEESLAPENPIIIFLAVSGDKLLLSKSRMRLCVPT
jgi:hypothetical protein